MSTQNSVHDNIEFLLKEKMNDAKNKTIYDIERSKKDMENGTIPTDGAPCQFYIQNLRRSALSRYSDIKTWFSASILEAINQYTQTDALQILLEKIEEIRTLDADIKKAEEDIQRVSNNIMQLKAYDKFLLYKRFISLGKKRHSQTEKENDDLLLNCSADALTQTYKNYIRIKAFYILIGIIITALCAAADFTILYSAFLSDNMAPTVAIKSSLISVIVLDLPPYILGLLMSKEKDSRRLWYLWDNPDDPGSKDESDGYKCGKVILILVIGLLFISYLAFRILLFLGGGDFNAALQFIFHTNLQSAAITYKGTDLLSTFIPFGTSAVTFAVGLMLSSSYTDYVKTSILVIDKASDDFVAERKKAIIDFEKKKDCLTPEISVLKQSIWTFYTGLDNGISPNNDASFVAKITDNYKQLTYPLYIKAYQVVSSQLRNEALRILQQINVELVPYSTNQMAVTSMEISDEENKVLDEIWVEKDDASQCAATIETLKEIDDHIKLFQQILKNNTNTPA